jgi:hypothetical protein
MKSLIIPALFLLLLTSCGQHIYSEKTEPCTTSVTGDTVVLVYQKASPVFQKCYDKLDATVSSITDSRCPVGVQCIWAGKVGVVLQLGNDFNISLEAGKQIDTSYQQKKFSFTLIDVVPHPSSGSPNPAPGAKAIVRIIKN